nr:zinc finger, CCHC-type, retrotransposon Gag domain protein [Tanacetum cinerariifolium]
MQRFIRLAGFLGASAGTAEEQAKNFQWGLRKSILNHLMCIPFTNVAQNTAASTSGQADKKPGASGHVFAFTEDYATKTS